MIGLSPSPAHPLTRRIRGGALVAARLRRVRLRRSAPSALPRRDRGRERGNAPREFRRPTSYVQLETALNGRRQAAPGPPRRASRITPTMPDGDDDLARRPSPTARAVAFVRQMLTVLALSFWFGGFTFYGSVVVPTALKVLGEHRAVGFITQPVTAWLNRIGVAALAVLLWNVVAERARPAGRSAGRWRRRGWRWRVSKSSLPCTPCWTGCWTPRPGGPRPPPVRRLAPRVLLVSTAQWGITVLHLAFILIGWRRTRRTTSCVGNPCTRWCPPPRPVKRPARGGEGRGS